MAIERRLFIAETAEEIIYAQHCCNYIGDFDNGKMYCDNTTVRRDMWYIDDETLAEHQEEIDSYE